MSGDKTEQCCGRCLWFVHHIGWQGRCSWADERLLPGVYPQHSLTTFHHDGQRCMTWEKKDD